MPSANKEQWVGSGVAGWKDGAGRVTRAPKRALRACAHRGFYVTGHSAGLIGRLASARPLKVACGRELEEEPGPTTQPGSSLSRDPPDQPSSCGYRLSAGGLRIVACIAQSPGRTTDSPAGAGRAPPPIAAIAASSQAARLGPLRTCRLSHDCRSAPRAVQSGTRSSGPPAGPSGLAARGRPRTPPRPVADPRGPIEGCRTGLGFDPARCHVAAPGHPEPRRQCGTARAPVATPQGSVGLRAPHHDER